MVRIFCPGLLPARVATSRRSRDTLGLCLCENKRCSYYGRMIVPSTQYPLDRNSGGGRFRNSPTVFKLWPFWSELKEPFKKNVTPKIVIWPLSAPCHFLHQLHSHVTHWNKTNSGREKEPGDFLIRSKWWHGPKVDLPTCSSVSQRANTRDLYTHPAARNICFRFVLKEFNGWLINSLIIIVNNKVLLWTVIRPKKETKNLYYPEARYQPETWRGQNMTLSITFHTGTF